MTDQTPFAVIPVAWLKSLPADYKIPVWRWLVLPATTIMLKRRGGAWVSGNLELRSDSLRFVQTKLTKGSPGAVASWTIALSSMGNIDVTSGLASESIAIEHADGVVKLLAVRSAEFVDLLRQALPQR